MTYAPTRYLAWARQFYGQIPYDLATSGVPIVTHAELGAPDDPVDPKAFARLRAAIARYNDVPEADTIAALGTSHALWLAYATLLSPGDDVLVEDPAYEPLLRSAEGLGARAVRFARPEAEGFALDPAKVERALTTRTRIVSVTNHHNPSGLRADDERLRAIARVCAARGAILLVDEVYAPFDALVDASGVFRGSARKLGPNVVAVASLTKCYGLGPHRIGWMLGPPDVIARADDVLTATVGVLPTPHASFGAHAFAHIDSLATRARDRLRGRRERVATWMSARPDLRWSAPPDGTFGFATSTRAGDLLPLLEAGARDLGVLVAAGTFFGMPNGFRLSWATLAGAELDEALARLGTLLPGA